MRSKILNHAAGIFLFLVFFILATAFTGFGNDVAFDSNAWLRSSARDRGRMASDLVDKKLLMGSSLEVAKQTLGSPDKDYGRVLQYKIDLGWPFKDKNTYGLQVHLDADQIVREVKIVD